MATDDPLPIFTPAANVSVGSTEAERHVLYHLGSAWGNFIFLKDGHRDDLPEFRAAIHQAQLIVAGRIARRLEPHVWLRQIEVDHR